MSDYKKYLADLHSQLTTPDEIIFDAVKEATNKTVINKNKIIAGEANEVYDVELSDNSHVIIRISRAEKQEFEQERWAIEKCREIGIPVPKILNLKHISFENKPLHICVQEKLEGEPLERGGINFHSFSEERKKKIIFQTGEILSKIHSIKTVGFGKLNESGKGSFTTFPELMREHVNQEKDYLSIAKDINFDLTAMKKIFRILKEKSDLFPDMEPVLNHNDFGPKHIMVKDDKITGILDFGEVSGHSPVNDFAKWDYWFSDEIPLDWLKRGYSNKTLFDDHFDEILHWIRLNNGLGVLWWYHSKNYSEAVEKAKQKLYNDLAFYSSN